MMVACVAIHDVKVLNLVKMMLGCVGGKDTCHAWVEAAAENGTKPCLLEAFTVRPLPRVLEVRLVLRLIVCSVEIVAARLQAGFHDGEVLIGQGKVHHNVGLVAAQQLDKLLHTVGIHLCSPHLRAVFLVEDFCQSHALLLRAAGNHYFCKRVRILTHLVGCNGGYTASSYN